MNPLEEMFWLGMKREVFTPLDLNDVSTQYDLERKPLILNLGAGTSIIEGTTPLDLPAWDADVDVIPYEDGKVDCIHAYHLLEHVDRPEALLWECHRVLRRGGLMNIVVPYGNGHLACQDMTHRHFFNEDSWKTLFSNPFYNPMARGLEPCWWTFEVMTNVIMGVKGTNLALLTQLMKTGV